MKLRTRQTPAHDEQTKRWTVGVVSKRTHVSVRTLHHYDQIGLLVPSERTDAGYRLYGATDLERLHQILVYRELGFTLDAIRRVLDMPAIDRRSELVAQRALLVESKRRTEAVIRAVDRTLESMERGTTMTTQEMFEGFEDLRNAPDDIRAHHAEHAKETHEQWGDTDAYAESMRRARKYSKAEWEELRRETERHEEHMAGLMDAGVDPESVEAMAAAEAMRQLITRCFYPCSPEMHAGLADMYESDARFREHYEKRAPGLATYTAKAIRANARGMEA
jgi:MerR family transcriptional regulator, thiopeptide resistance regulator